MSEKERIEYCGVPCMKMKETLELYEWVRRGRKHFLRIKDIIKLKPGTKMKVLLLDRNTGDITMNPSINKPNVAYTPERFFKNYYAIYTHKKGLRGSIKYSWQSRSEKPIPFEWEIEYAPKHWYPLSNGLLPAVSSDFYNDLIDGRPRHWSEFPKDTLVGWRGPSVRWNALKNMAKIYWTELKY